MRKVLIALAIVLAPATGIAQEAEECSIGTVGNDNQIVVSHPNGVAIWFGSPFWFIWNPSTGLPQAPALWDLGFCSNRDAVAVALTKAMWTPRRTGFVD